MRPLPDIEKGCQKVGGRLTFLGTGTLVCQSRVRPPLWGKQVSLQTDEALCLGWACRGRWPTTNDAVRASGGSYNRALGLSPLNRLLAFKAFHLLKYESHSMSDHFVSKQTPISIFRFASNSPNFGCEVISVYPGCKEGLSVIHCIHPDVMLVINWDY